MKYPFLLLDELRSNIPEDFMSGFPQHPHRGIETMTYALAETVDHNDSLGNRWAIGIVGIQWTTAGRGTIHQEMPNREPRPPREWISVLGESSGRSQDDDAARQECRE